VRRRRPPPRICVQVVTEHTAEVRGDGVFRVLEQMQCPRQFQYRPPSGGGPCWTIRRRDATDVEAMTEHLGGSCIIDGQQALL
jgi:hypothetical protein